MEQIVRPFQLIDPLATIRTNVTQNPGATVSTAHLCWGAAGTLPTPVQQAENFDGVNIRTEECDTQLGEQSRKTEDVRVEQPGKPQNFVIVQRIRVMTLAKTDKKQFTGIFHTDTTDFGLTDFFAGSGFGDIKTQAKCKEQIYYNR